MTPAQAAAAVETRLKNLHQAGRQNSPEAIEFRAYQTLLNWLNKSGDDPERFLRILNPHG